MDRTVLMNGHFRTDIIFADIISGKDVQLHKTVLQEFVQMRTSVACWQINAGKGSGKGSRLYKRQRNHATGKMMKMKKKLAQYQY